MSASTARNRKGGTIVRSVQPAAGPPVGPAALGPALERPNGRRADRDDAPAAAAASRDGATLRPPGTS